MNKKQKNPDLPKPIPLAIVGIGCLFPKANDAKSYWTNIRDGVDAITEIPKTHWQAQDYFDEDQNAPDMTYARRGGFIDPVDFDPLLYGLSPNNIEATDTTQLLGMVVARQALLDAGYATGQDSNDGRAFDRDRTSVILGVTGTLKLVIPLGARLGHPIWRKALAEAGVEQQVAADVVQRISEAYVPWQENSFPGLLGNVAAGRIANRFDLGGTNCVVDAACASSLSAIHMAAMELYAGRADMAITGGLDTFNDIFMYMCFSKTPALSPTGNSKPFDHNGDGTILGEGLGAVILKRLSDAKRDGDKVYAVIKSIGSSSDGKGNAIYAPSASGQTKALKNAYREAGVAPGSIELVEAHGTGTKVGDAVEAEALSGVYREDKAEGSWCAIGSVKSMIGHTKAAAGVAGLIKVALALQNKVLPPTIKVERPLDVLAPGSAPVYVNANKRPWIGDRSQARRAALSAFGFGGSNFHCVLEEAQALKPAIEWDGKVLLFSFSADSASALQTQLQGIDSEQGHAQLRAAAARSRQTFNAQHGQRLVFVIGPETDVPALFNGARQMLQQPKASWETPDGAYYNSASQAGKLAVLFPGQGSQYCHMLLDLACQFPQMQQALIKADSVFSESGNDLRLSDLIYPVSSFTKAAQELDENNLRATQHAQAAIGVSSLGAWQVLQHFGIRADAVAGHSFGELTALCAGDCIDEHSLYKLAMKRGELMQVGAGDHGSMLAVSASAAVVHEFLEAEQLDLIIANNNAPRQVVLSGATAQIEKAIALLDKRGLQARQLPVAAAFHSSFVAAAEKPLAEFLRDIQFHQSDIDVFANSTASAYPRDHDAAKKLLAGQLARPVEFIAQIENMFQAGCRTFIEVGPGNTLTGLVKSILSEQPPCAVALDASKGKRGGQYDLACLLAQLAVRGHSVDLDAWDAGYLENHPDTAGKKPAMTIALGGANYVKQKKERAPAPKRTGNTKTNTMTQKSASADSAPASRESVDNNALLQATQQSILALQKMQEQTAKLHRQYLEGQETAQQAIQQLIQQQQQIFSGAEITQAFIPAIPAPAQETTASTPPAPPPEATLAVTEAKDDVKYETLLLEIVAEKTGYPVEMLSMDMSLDTDLGIDSIKRVEILSALQERLPGMQKIQAEDLGTFQLLKHIVEFLASDSGVNAAATVPVVAENAADNSNLKTVLLEVVADKTGYPAEMLELAMNLDTDLGIDSIKRVEILSAFQEQMPEAPMVNPEDLASLQTLQQIVDFMQTNTATSVVTTSQAPIANDKLQSVLLKTVADKTGYPAEMLELTMNLDTDLGIDSIKRVEILSAFQEQMPEAPMVNPEDLASLQTLQQIVDFMQTNTATSVAATSQVRAPIANDKLQSVLLKTVADKTGYPAEMLELTMNLDTDLGIDSIKRVEILSAFQEQMPEAPMVNPEDLASLQTLQQIVDFMQTNTAASVAATSQAPIANDKLQSVLLKTVADKTGYPAEMLELAMNLDTDLGIDSIKRVEILSAFQEQMPEAPMVNPEDLASLQTLQQIVDFMQDSEIQQTAPSAVSVAEEITSVDQPALYQGVVAAVPLGENHPPVALNENDLVYVTDDGSDLVEKICKALEKNKLQSQIISIDEKNIEAASGLILLAPKDADDEFLQSAFTLVQACSHTLRGAGRQRAAILASITRLGGSFGIQALSPVNVEAGGLSGLIKTADKEWPEVHCKAIDIPANRSNAKLATNIVAAILQAGPPEVGMTDKGACALNLKTQAAPADNKNTHPLVPGDVLVVTGGARGVTAAVAVALAEKYGVNLLLLGRTPVPGPEPEWLLGINDKAAIKKAILHNCGAQQTPKEIDATYQSISAQREVLLTLAKIQTAGVRANYESVDVRDATAVTEAVARARKSLGPVSGIIHGAGVLADKLIEDKTIEQFRQVYSTKVDGMRALLKATAKDELKTLVIFSSSTARFGRKGQVDYAIANEVLNKIAQRQQMQRPGCRVISANWGPWDGGMVTPQLKKLFHSEGVGVISLQAGTDHLMQELARTGAVELVLLGSEPQEQNRESLANKIADNKLSLAFDRKLTIENYPVLKSHVMNGKAVLPVALIAEWLAHGAIHNNPGLSFIGINDLRVFKGVILQAEQSIDLQIMTAQAEIKGDENWVRVELRSRHVLHVQAQIVLGHSYASAAQTSPIKITESYPYANAEYYKNGELFHGADLQGIDSIQACSAQGIIGQAKPAPAPSKWMAQAVRSSWLADPLILDSAFQMMILWSFHNLGAGSLPTAIGKYRQYQRSFPKAGVQIKISIQSSNQHNATATVEFFDNSNKLVARMENYECVIDVSLHEAFKRNELDELQT